MPDTLPVVLTYHSQNIGSHTAADNDHVALREDLEALHQAGIRIVPLSRVVDWLDGPSADEGAMVCLSFDDGCDFDFRDLEWPGVGVQRSMLGILQDFRSRHGASAQPGLHATTFVIASPEARSVIDRGSLFGRDWIRDDWWSAAIASGLISVGNHGWDHNHPDLPEETGPRGGFKTISNRALCESQVVRAARYIEATAGEWPELFAYPFGESSEYIRDVFFPEFTSLHGCRAAFGTEPGPVTRSSNRWNLPRYVCGRDWSSREELISLIRA